jgi:hypothetical protein
VEPHAAVKPRKAKRNSGSYRKEIGRVPVGEITILEIVKLVSAFILNIPQLLYIVK